MKKEDLQNFRKYYLNEFEYYDGECFITFNIVGIDTARNEITVAISNRGRISVCAFDLKTDGDRLYFEYGPTFDKIDLADFENMETSEEAEQ